MSVETKIKKALNDIVTKSIKSKEQVSTIIIGENDNKPKSEVENIELDLSLLQNNLKSEFKNLLKILEEHKINTSEIKFTPECITNNYEEVNTIVNKIYDCLFKKAIDDSSLLNSLLSFVKDNWKISSGILLILILIFIYFKFIKKST
jgi:hypothetical protein